MTTALHGRGEFWLPAHPDKKVRGELEWQPGDGPVVRFFGPLGPPPPPGVYSFGGGPIDRIDVVHGELLEEGKVTILEVLNFGLPNFAGVQQASATALGGVLIGDHIGDEAGPPRLAAMRVELGLLLDWSARTTLRDVHVDPDDPEIRVVMEVAIPPHVEAVLDDAAVALELQCRRSGGRSGRRLFEDRAFLVVRPTEPLTTREFDRRYLTPLRNFMTFASLKPARVLSLAFEPESADVQPRPRELRFLSSMCPSEPDELADREDVHNMLFSHGGSSDLEAMLRGWFNVTREAPAVISHLLATEYIEGLWVSTRFLLSAFAIEGYHQFRYADASDDTQDRLRDAVLASCSEDHRDWLQRVLPRGPSFARRLTDLVRDAGPVIGAMTGDAEAFARRVRDLRGRLAHGGASPGIENDLEMWWASIALRWVLRWHLLREIGFDAAQVNAIVGQSQRFALDRGQRPADWLAGAGRTDPG